MTKHQKDPDERLDFVFDWTDTLEDGETISTWGLGIDDPPDNSLQLGTGPFAATRDGARVLVWTIGGTMDKSYAVRNRITTSQGRIYDETILVYVAQN